MFFFERVLDAFWKDLGAEIEEKSIQKRCQKHVGIDLEVEPAKTKNMAPLTQFWCFF